ncbi:unnamed protein product [Rotaria sordida]|uniref:Uncharacterized protein n=1 Tax=Rotaria sordida TaxID=392033 RepID=A0A818Y1S8_9BILA|nr:unnamed protein product [Rotaria sordida]CAF3746805.1 unnamed protein product [Rotaria sordida]
MLTFDNTHFPERPLKHHSTTLIDEGIASLTDEIPALQSIVTNHNTNNSTSNFDDVTNVLRKVLFQNLIKNPKTLQGEKDDVTKWLEDLEHLFDVAYIPDTNKLDIISYLLRGEVLQW